MENFENKRKHKRYNCEITVQFVPTSHLGLECKCKGRDISEGGIGFLLSREPLDGADADVFLDLPKTNSKLRLRAKVVWSHPSKTRTGVYESGVEFIGISDEKREILRQYLERYST